MNLYLEIERVVERETDTETRTETESEIETERARVWQTYRERQ